MTGLHAPNPRDIGTETWTIDVRIRFSHCDPAGIVYFPRAFDILQSVIEDWFIACLGLDYYGIIAQRRVGLGFAHAECDFARPSKMGDVLTFAVGVERLGTKSLSLAIPARRGRDSILKAAMVIVATDLDRHVSIAIPDDIREAVAAYRERTS